MLVRKSSVALVVAYCAGIALVLVGPSLLPARFYFDSGTIREAIELNAPVAFGDSYANTAFAYRLLGFPGFVPDALAGPVTFSLAFAAVVLASGIRKLRWNPATFVLFAAWTVLMAVFVGMYSKELFAIVAIALAVAACRSRAGVAVGVLVVLAYALLFRTYWAVIDALWITLLVTWRARGNWATCLLALALVLIPISMASHSFADLWLSDGRTIVLEGREGDPDTTTAIANALLNTSPLTDVANVAIGWLMLIFPVYLFALAAPQHIAFAVFQLYNTGLFLKTARHARLPRPEQRTAVEATTRRVAKPTGTELQYTSAMLLCVAYTVTQGMFEPDFGSFAKHEINILPAFFYLLCHRRRRGIHAKSVAANVNAPQSTMFDTSEESGVLKNS